MADACYGCVHSRPIEGRFLACWHPATARAHDDQLAPWITACGNALPLAVPGLTVEGCRGGVEMGQFSWPFRFDPIWLVSCDGYEPESEAA
jgi:hypothetical protein